MTRRLASALLAASAIAAAAPAALAQSPEELRLPERMDQALRDMMDSMKPALDELLDSLEPALDDMQDYMQGFETLGDPRHYQMPEVLPNGDIIIRRRDDAPPLDPDAPAGPDIAPEDEDGIRT